MKTFITLALLIGAFGIGRPIAVADDGADSQDYFLEADLEACCSHVGFKKWKGHVRRIVETIDGRIVRERFVARAAFSSSSLSAINKPLAKQGVTLRLSNTYGPYAECHLPLKNFDVEIKDWKWVTSAAFSVSFDAGMKKNQWVMKKTKKDEFCVINLGHPDVHGGIPEIQEGDLIDVLEGSARVLEGEVRLEDDSWL